MGEVAKVDDKKTKAVSKGKGKNKKTPVQLSNDELTEIIYKIREGKSNKQLTKENKINPGMINKIKVELSVPRREKKEGDTLPSFYFSPRNISQRVDNILYDMGYVKVDNK